MKCCGYKCKNQLSEDTTLTYCPSCLKKPRFGYPWDRRLFRTNNWCLFLMGTWVWWPKFTPLDACNAEVSFLCFSFGYNRCL